MLSPRDPAGLARFIAAVSDHRSTRYGRYLTPRAFAARFGPAPSAVDAVTAQLRRRGLAVGAISNGRMLVRFSGTAAAVAGLVGRRAPSGARSGGSAGRFGGLIGPIAAIIGPGSTAVARPADLRHPVPAQVPLHPAARSAPFAHPRGSPRGCGAARAASVANDGLTDDQIARAYGAFGLYGAGDRGAGQRIAVYENEPFLTLGHPDV